MHSSRVTMLWAMAVSIASIGAEVLLPLTSPFGLAPGDSPATLTVYGIAGLLWLTAIMVSLARQPANPLWKLMLAYLAVSRLVFALQFVPYPVMQSLASTFTVSAIALFVHVLVAYPTGHLRTRFDRTVVLFIYAFVVGVVLLAAAMQTSATDCKTAWCPENVLLIWPNDELVRAVTRATDLAAPIIGTLVVYAIWRHWRVAAPAARRVLLPVAVAVVVTYFIRSLGYLGEALDSDLLQEAMHYPSLVADAIVPLGLLLGVLRLRLGRGRVAGLVVELGRGVPAGGLRDALARALGDPTLQLAFAAPNASGYIDGAGHPVQLAAEDRDRAIARIERDGEPLAVLVHDPTIDVEDPGLVEAVSSAARLAIENERLTAQVRAQLEEVRASRARIVEAGDEERRKVERDLHDGAQQRLVALTMRLEHARATTTGSARLIDEATAELREAIAEVRSLARGLYPPILTEAGLAAAVESLAERTPVPVDVRIPDARFPPAIEVTAYFVVAEALTNVARYAGATSAQVHAAVADDVLTVTITDDGRGGADPGPGTGLRGLNDRVGAIGGSLEIDSAPGEGTTVRATLPLSADRR
jgi:signal transduction histidine kinase